MSNNAENTVTIDNNAQNWYEVKAEPITFDFEKSSVDRARSGLDLKNPVSIVQFWWDSSPKHDRNGFYRTDFVVNDIKALEDADYNLNLSGFVAQNADGHWINQRQGSVLEIVCRLAKSETSVLNGLSFVSVQSFRKAEFAKIARVSESKAAKILKDPDAIKDQLDSVGKTQFTQWTDLIKKIPSTADYLMTCTALSSTGKGDKEKVSGTRTCGWLKMENVDNDWVFQIYEGPVLRMDKNNPDFKEFSYLLDEAKGLMVGNDVKALIVDPLLPETFSIGRQLYGLSPDSSFVDTAEIVARTCREVGMKIGAAIPMVISTKMHAESGSSLLLSNWQDELDSVKAAIAKVKNPNRIGLEKYLDTLASIDAAVKGFEVVLAYAKHDTDTLVSDVNSLRLAIEARIAAKPVNDRKAKKAEKAHKDWIEAQRKAYQASMDQYNALIEMSIDPEKALTLVQVMNPNFIPNDPVMEKADKA